MKSELGAKIGEDGIPKIHPSRNVGENVYPEHGVTSTIQADFLLFGTPKRCARWVGGGDYDRAEEGCRCMLTA